MDLELLLSLAAGLISGLFAVELGQWVSRASVFIVRQAARALPDPYAERYADELTAEIRNVRTGIGKLAYATRIALAIPFIRRSLTSRDSAAVDRERQREQERLRGVPVQLSALGFALLTALAGSLIYAAATAGSLSADLVLRAGTTAVALAGLATSLFAVSTRRRKPGQKSDAKEYSKRKDSP
ncbi:hypothetical protein NCC78_08175 [Micromonospora phytophila]|uniref:hypothetical protein n=1 Tax=Micromonospora phytophila TaxID=709888 RepID=UPI00202DB9B5|nr:hypothetical protein [Micromonospora phytophila]MCM0674663.1 hypothetical protein [Micromonospora phytophila]